MSYRLFNSIEYERYLWWKIVNSTEYFYSSRLIFQTSISDFRNTYAIEIYECIILPEADVRRHSVKKMFPKISQNSQVITCAGGVIPGTWIKKRLLHRCFPVFLWNTSKQLLPYWPLVYIFILGDFNQ